MKSNRSHWVSPDLGNFPVLFLHISVQWCNNRPYWPRTAGGTASEEHKIAPKCGTIFWKLNCSTNKSIQNVHFYCFYSNFYDLARIWFLNKCSMQLLFLGPQGDLYTTLYHFLSLIFTFILTHSSVFKIPLGKAGERPLIRIRGMILVYTIHWGNQ